jgi:hypothetical protein
VTVEARVPVGARLDWMFTAARVIEIVQAAFCILQHATCSTLGLGGTFAVSDMPKDFGVHWVTVIWKSFSDKSSIGFSRGNGHREER